MSDNETPTPTWQETITQILLGAVYRGIRKEQMGSIPNVESEVRTINKAVLELVIGEDDHHSYAWENPKMPEIARNQLRAVQRRVVGGE